MRRPLGVLLSIDYFCRKLTLSRFPAPSILAPFGHPSSFRRSPTPLRDQPAPGYRAKACPNARQRYDEPACWSALKSSGLYPTSVLSPTNHPASLDIETPFLRSDPLQRRMPPKFTSTFCRSATCQTAIILRVRRQYRSPEPSTGKVPQAMWMRSHALPAFKPDPGFQEINALLRRLRHCRGA